MWLLWVAFAITWLFLAFVTWTLMQMVRQAGRLIAQDREARKPAIRGPPAMSLTAVAASGQNGHAVVPASQAAPAPAYTGLPVGADAPAFDPAGPRRQAAHPGRNGEASGS